MNKGKLAQAPPSGKDEHKPAKAQNKPLVSPRNRTETSTSGKLRTPTTRVGASKGEFSSFLYKPVAKPQPKSMFIFNASNL
jgi:hypothetical protein